MSQEQGRPHVAIVGGGIGGLVAAIALARADVAVSVFERAPSYERVGGTTELGPNATRLLDELGLLARLRAVSVRPEAMELRRWADGSVLLRTPLGEAAERHFGAPALEFLRPDLQDVLAGGVPAGSLRLGAPVAALEQDEDGVEVVLESGERVRADVAIAADGIHSQLRRQLAGPDDPVYSGTVVYRGEVPRARVGDLGLENVKYFWLGPGRHVVAYWVSGGEVLGANLAIERADEAPESWTEHAPTAEALACFDGWHEPVREMIRRCGEQMLRGAVFVRRPLERWAYGRAALLGDAIHAMVPFQAQGGAQSIEDAIVLAGCVRGRAREELPGALRRYEQLRAARAFELQESSRGRGDFLNLPDGEAQRERDAQLMELATTQPWGLRQGIWEHDVRDQLQAGV